MLRRILHSRRVWRFAFAAFLVCAMAAAAGVVTFLVGARRVQPDFRPVDTPLAPEVAAQINRIEGYRRAEDATYLTFAEWYLVFNPQEYAAFLAKDRPSRFPYFRGIGQIWGGYREVYGIARRHYPFNGGYNLMLMVISGSSTVEFAIKGVYEKTVGRFFEWTAGGERTAEDGLAAQVAHDYGAFIPTRPWFEFPFGAKLRELWTTTGFFGPHFLRKCERKLFLSLEYGVKAIYAAVIRVASHSVYGIASTEVYLSAHEVPKISFERAGVRRVQQLGPRHWMLAVPHYQGFTDTVPQLARDGLEFDEIAGNDEIMLTLVAPAGWSCDLPGVHPLFSMPLLTGAEAKRVAVQVPVRALGDTLRTIEAKGLRLEHLFDY